MAFDPRDPAFLDGQAVGLIPDAGELSATLFIEIPEIARLSPQEVRVQVDGFLGLQNGCVVLELQGERVPARFETGRSREERMSAVQFMRFAVPAAPRVPLADTSSPASLAVEHPNYRARAPLPPETRAALAADLADA